MKKANVMQTVVDLPDSLYQKSKTLAASRGATVEEFIVEDQARGAPKATGKLNCP
jgi:hypothetical protein